MISLSRVLYWKIHFSNKNNKFWLTPIQLRPLIELWAYQYIKVKYEGSGQATLSKNCTKSFVWFREHQVHRQRPGGIVINQHNTNINTLYYMAEQIRVLWLVLSQSGFHHTDHFHGNGHKLRTFCFRKPANSKQAWAECHIINYLLT